MKLIINSPCHVLAMAVMLGLACLLSGCALGSFSISNQPPPPGGCVGEPHRVQC